jgi:hypothetical protein
MQYLVNSHAAPTTVVACSTRDEFLRILLSDCQQNNSISSASPSPDYTGRSKHPLLIPSIRLLAQSESIFLAFAPTLMHLRAYLSAFTRRKEPQHRKPAFEKPGTFLPTLAIINPMEVHRLAGELSAQGLSRTVALAVDVASQHQMQLVVTEYRGNKSHDMLDVGDRASEDLWDEQVPVLNGSMRFGGADQEWTSRTVRARSVFEHWCSFERMHQSE